MRGTGWYLIEKIGDILILSKTCGKETYPNKKITKFGVLAPEACGLDPDDFFDELSGFLGDGAQIKTIVTQETVN